MNDSPDPRTRLLAETLQGDWDAAPAEFARQAAAHARRHRRMRRTLGAAGALATAAAVLGFFVLRQPANQPAASMPSPTAPSRGYEIISDQELLRLVKDRPLLVRVSKTGAEEIVVLKD